MHKLLTINQFLCIFQLSPGSFQNHLPSLNQLTSSRVNPLHPSHRLSQLNTLTDTHCQQDFEPRYTSTLMPDRNHTTFVIEKPQEKMTHRNEETSETVLTPRYTSTPVPRDNSDSEVHTPRHTSTPLPPQDTTFLDTSTQQRSTKYICTLASSKNTSCAAEKEEIEVTAAVPRSSSTQVAENMIGTETLKVMDDRVNYMCIAPRGTSTPVPQSASALSANEFSSVQSDCCTSRETHSSSPVGDMLCFPFCYTPQYNKSLNQRKILRSKARRSVSLRHSPAVKALSALSTEQPKSSVTRSVSVKQRTGHVTREYSDLSSIARESVSKRRRGSSECSTGSGSYSSLNDTSLRNGTTWSRQEPSGCEANNEINHVKLSENQETSSLEMPSQATGRMNAGSERESRPVSTDSAYSSDFRTPRRHQWEHRQQNGVVERQRKRNIVSRMKKYTRQIRSNRADCSEELQTLAVL